jgi:CBS domain-containing protein
MKRTVRQLLDGKGHSVWSISPDEPVLEALKLMADKNVGALVVLDRGKLVGILSERDYVRRAILQENSPLEVPVREMMTTRVITVGLDRTIEECMALMTDRRIRHLPVVEDDRLVGILSIGDLVKAVIDEQSFVIEQLEKYITGAR